MTGIHSSRPGASPLVRASALPAAATVLVFLPELALLPDATEGAAWVRVLWLVLLLVAAPLVAWWVNHAHPFALRARSALLTGLPQLVLLPALVALDVRLDVMRGYLLAGTGEEAMAYGIGLTLATVLGLTLTVLVAGAGHLGARARKAEIA